MVSKEQTEEIPLCEVLAVFKSPQPPVIQHGLFFSDCEASQITEMMNSLVVKSTDRQLSIVGSMSIS